MSAILSLAACGSFESRLRLEREIPEMHALGQAHDAMTRRTSIVLSDAGPGDPLKVAIHEVGTGESERVVVAVHGIVSDHRVWRYVAGGLGGELDIWAVDLPGCGKSEIRDPGKLEEEAYSPTWLAKHVLAALRARLSTRDRPVRLTLLGHSLGGGVLLRLLGDPELRREYADVLALVDGAVLMSPLDFGLSTVDPTLIEIAGVTDVAMVLGTALGLVRSRTAESIYRSAVDSDRVPREEFDRTFEILVDPRRRHAVQQMLKSMHFDKETKGVNWKKSQEWVEHYKNIDTPCLIVWGVRDQTLPRASGNFLRDAIRGSKLRFVRDSMHCLPTEEPRLCIDLIRGFLGGEFESWPDIATLDRPPAVEAAWTGEQEGLRPSQKDSVSRGHEKPATTAPSTVTVLLGKDIQRSGVRHLSDAFRLVPGAEVQRISPTESGVAFRGYVDSATATQGTLGLVDGRQVHNPYLGNVLWDQLAVRIEDIDRVEIIRGPGSFIHGPNAMHGVVSIKTKSPLDYSKDSVSVIGHAGSYSSAVVGATVVSRTENTGFKITVQRDDIDLFDGTSRNTRDKTFFESAFEVQLDGDPNHVAGLTFGASDQEFDILLPKLEAIPATKLINSGQELFTTASYRTGDPNEDAIKALVSWTGFDSTSEPQQFYLPFSLDLDTVDADLQVTRAFESHFLTAGGGYRRSTFVTDNRDVSIGRHSVDQIWAFAQDEISVTDDLSLTLGARLDGHSVTGTTVAPRAAAVWEVVNEHYARASAGRGFRNPSLRELWFDMPVTGVPSVPGTILIRGNEQLQAEELTSFELGYVGSWGPLLEVAPGAITPLAQEDSVHQFEVGISTFYNLIDDLISFQGNPLNPLLVAPVNQGEEEAFGFEVEGRYVFSNSFSSFANYTHTVRRNRETDLRNPLTPKHVINAGLTHADHGFTSMIWAHYYDRTQLFGIDIPSYVLINGSISYRFLVNQDSTGQAFIRVFNLLDDDHREHPQGDAYGLIFTMGLQFDW